MSAASRVPAVTQRRPQPRQLTLLDLVQAVGEVTEDEQEVVATVVFLLRTGRVELRGNFRGSGADRFC